MEAQPPNFNKPGGIMRIKYTPQDDDGTGREAVTPLGSFVPGEVREIGDRPQSVRAARQLVANGDFEETDEDSNSAEVRAEAMQARAEAGANRRARMAESLGSAEAGMAEETGEEAKKPAAKKSRKRSAKR
jgi:hypothetical protein